MHIYRKTGGPRWGEPCLLMLPVKFRADDSDGHFALEKRQTPPIPQYPSSGPLKQEVGHSAAPMVALSWMAYASTVLQNAARSHFPTPSQVMTEMHKKDQVPRFRTRAAQAAGAISWVAWVGLLFALLIYVGTLVFHFKNVYDDQYTELMEVQSVTVKAAGLVCTTTAQQKTEMCKAALVTLQQNAKNEAFDKTMAHICGDIFACSFVRENFKSALGPVVVLLPVLFLLAVVMVASAAWKGAVNQWASRMYASKVRSFDRIPSESDDR